MQERDVFSDLEREETQLEALLDELPRSAWDQPSACTGWSIKDVVLHLAQTEEAVIASVAGRQPAGPDVTEVGSVDALMDRWVDSERHLAAQDVFARWKAARRSALDALQDANPATPLPWVAAPLRPRTLATTRLAEHWAHALDVAAPLHAPYPDDDRLWHVARLAHRTLPYAFGGANKPPPSVRFDLAAPSGARWSFGPDDAATLVRGHASELCRIAARRLAPAQATTVEASGPDGADVLALIRTYA